MQWTSNRYRLRPRGFDEWRNTTSDVGGYNPTVTPSVFSLNRNLYVDNGRALD